LLFTHRTLLFPIRSIAQYFDLWFLPNQTGKDEPYYSRDGDNK
jgi:hypothetical protein